MHEMMNYRSNGEVIDLPLKSLYYQCFYWRRLIPDSEFDGFTEADTICGQSSRYYTTDELTPENEYISNKPSGKIYTK
jgi:hypothetical protein